MPFLSGFVKMLRCGKGLVQLAEVPGIATRRDSSLAPHGLRRWDLPRPWMRLRRANSNLVFFSESWRCPERPGERLNVHSWILRWRCRTGSTTVWTGRLDSSVVWRGTWPAPHRSALGLDRNSSSGTTFAFGLLSGLIDHSLRPPRTRRKSSCQLHDRIFR